MKKEEEKKIDGRRGRKDAALLKNLRDANGCLEKKKSEQKILARRQEWERSEHPTVSHAVVQDAREF